MTAETDIGFDPFQVRWFEDPYPAYRRMRTECPVYRCDIPDARIWPHFWMLSRAGDVNDALADWRTFSSSKGTLIDTDASLLPPNIFNMDPPRHDELRAVLARVLTPARVAALEEHLREMVRELLDAVKEKGRFDASRDFSQLIPTLTMCELMDLPTEARPKFLKWNLDTLAGSDFTDEAALRAYAEMGEYWQEIVGERRKRAGGDLISQILHSEVEGDAISDEEVAGFCSLLHDASQNTTMNMIANGIISLARFPEERRKLVERPERWSTALEELLRFVSPVQGLARVATRDVELHGVTIPRGDQVLLLYGSANHDETRFEDPDVLDIDRDARTHWTFGHGIHFCLGNAVARLETRVALEGLLEVIPDYEIEESGVVRNQLVPTRGVATAPVLFDPISGV